MTNKCKDFRNHVENTPLNEEYNNQIINHMLNCDDCFDWYEVLS